MAAEYKLYVYAINHTKQDLVFEAEDRINALVKKYLPHGSGFDSGTKFIYGRSNYNKLLFSADFHHMDKHGCYDGWTEHSVIITPDLAFGFNVKVTGRNRNGIKEYISDHFSDIYYDE